MKITRGDDFVNSFVVGVYLGNMPVDHVFLGDNQLYPEDTSGMRRLAVELPADGTLEWAYWEHAVSAIEDLVTPNRYMDLSVGGSRFIVRSSFNELPSVLLENGVFMFYPDEGASLHSVQPGDYVDVRAFIPAIEDRPLSIRTQDDGGERNYSLPFLPNMGLYLQWNKGQKKKSAGIRYALTGRQSGVGHIVGSGQKNGHGRGKSSGVAWPWPCRVVNANNWGGHNAYVQGDWGMRLTMQGFNSCSNMIGKPLYPAFTKTFRLKVVSIA